MTEGEALARPFPVDGVTVSAGALSDVVLLSAELAVELRRFVLGVIRDPELAEDVMQATFLKAIEHGNEPRSETARGWLFRVAFHEALTVRRRQAARDKGHRRLAGFRPKDDVNAVEGLVRRETIEAVRKAVSELPEEQRRVVQARVYEEKTFAEIASDFGLPLGTVLTRMRRALEKMRRHMRPGV